MHIAPAPSSDWASHSWWAGGFILAAAAVVWLYLPRPDKVGMAAQAIVALVIMASGCGWRDTTDAARPSRACGRVPMVTREAQRRLRGAPSMRSPILGFVAVLAVFCCCTGSKRGPHHFWCGPLTCGNAGRGDRI
jgi:hypothetical protein